MMHMNESTKLEFRYRRIGQLSDVSDLAEMLFPGNRNQQHAFLVIWVTLKWTKEKVVSDLTEVAERNAVSRRTLERTRAKISPAELLQGVDLALFEALADWRRMTADAAGVPAFVVFGDRTLIDLAQRRPADEANLRLAYGVAAQKVADYGSAVLDLVESFCRERQLERNCQPAIVPAPNNPRPLVTDSSRAAWPYFEQGKSCAEVAQLMGRALSTVEGYLTSYLTESRVTDPSPWVGAEDAAVIERAIEQVGDERLKPIFEFLAGQQPYAAIRVVVSCRRNRAAKGDGGHFQ